MWEEAVVASFEMLSEDLPEGYQENHDKSQPE
jgi:hypothetical protein